MCLLTDKNNQVRNGVNHSIMKAVSSTLLLWCGLSLGPSVPRLFFVLGEILVRVFPYKDLHLCYHPKRCGGEQEERHQDIQHDRIPAAGGG